MRADEVKKKQRGMINGNFNQLPFICNLVPFFRRMRAHAYVFAML